jgi:1,4-alpha-glucan branching enzyme
MPQGHLLLILHAHLPYVRHPEYDRFLEERWFFEAVVETYIPLIKFFDRMKAEGVPFKLTLSVSPTLASMMEDPLLRQRCLRHIEMSLQLAELECERTGEWPDVNFLSKMYRQLFEEAREIFVERCGTRLLTAFQEFAHHLRRHARLPAPLALRACDRPGPGADGRSGARTTLRQQAGRHVAAGVRLLPRVG